MAKIRKALIAAAGATVSALVAAVIAHGGGMPSAAEIGAAVGLGVAAGWAAWRVPNAPQA